MFTEPSINYQQALAPYQPMAMKVVHCPIDTSLNFTQAKKLLRDTRPNTLVIPHRYTQPPASAPARQDLVIDVDITTLTFQKNDIIKIPLVRKLGTLLCCTVQMLMLCYNQGYLFCSFAESKDSAKYSKDCEKWKETTKFTRDLS